MTLDFLILFLLLISFIVNFLALFAFRRTPRLRTISNRFVVNLLIINLANCCILGSTILLVGNMTATLNKHSDDTLDIIKRDSTTDHHRLASHRNRMILENGALNNIERSEVVLKYDSQYLEKLPIKERDTHILIIQEEKKGYNKVAASSTIEPTQLMRFWSIDLAAALGVLSVLVVVGDTWMAVRDPLRYYSRVSEVKAWLLIILTWALGIIFGVMSAYRQINFECTTVISKKRHSLSAHSQLFTFTKNTIFSIIFTCVYFVVIILLPFGFVCGMYWRIFSEAKENGLRMRKHTSSPLLQIKTNFLEKDKFYGMGLHVNVTSDTNNADEKITIPESHPAFEPLSNLEGTSDEDDIPKRTFFNFPSTGEEVNQNHPFEPCLKRFSEKITASDRFYAIPQIYLTPNLQKYNIGYGNFFSGLETTSNLRYTSCQALEIRTTHISANSISYMTAIHHRFMRASSVFMHREESRAARISILVVIMFLVSYLPYGFMVLLQGSQVIKHFAYSTQLAVFMILLANFSSAFIFAYRNKRVRHGVTRLLGMDTHSRRYRLQHLVTKVSMGVKQNSSNLSAYSKYIAPILKRSRKSLQNTKYNNDTVGVYLTNLASIQSSTMFGNIAVFNAAVDIQPEYIQGNASILKKIYRRSRNIRGSKQSYFPVPIAV